MGNFLSFLKKGNSEPESSLLVASAPLTTKPLQSLQHKEPPRIKFAKDGTPFTTLLEIQPDLLRFAFSFLRSEDIYRMRALNHYMYYLISNHVDLYFMNQVMLPRILQQLACKRVKSVKIVSREHSPNDTKWTIDWLTRNTGLREIEIIGFQLSESPHLLKFMTHLLPDLNYFSIGDRNCSYNSEYLDFFKDSRVKHLCLKSQGDARKTTAISYIDPRSMTNLTELTLHSLKLNTTTLENLESWINNPSSTVEGLHLINPIFSSLVDTRPLFEEALARKLSLKRLTVSFGKLSHNLIQHSSGLAPSELLTRNFFSPKSSIEELKIDAMDQRHKLRDILSHLGRMNTLKSFTWRGTLTLNPCIFINKDCQLNRLVIENASVVPATLFSRIICSDSNLSYVKIRETPCLLENGTKFENRALTSLILNVTVDLSRHMESIATASFTPSIRILDVSLNIVDPRPLAAMISKCENLEQFSAVRCFKVNSRWHGYIDALFDAILCHKSLRDVQIGGNYINISTFTGLHRLLENPHITNLGMNLISLVEDDCMTTQNFSLAMRNWRTAMSRHPNLQVVSLPGFCGTMYNGDRFECMKRILTGRESEDSVPLPCVVLVE